MIAAVHAARAKQVKTYALFVGRVDQDTTRDHMQEVAQEGGGHTSFYEAAGAASLREALIQIIGAQVSCELALNGKINDPEKACEGTVKLGQRTLQCGSDWKALTDSRIEVLGGACDELKAGAELTATFPCGSITLY